MSTTRVHQQGFTLVSAIFLLVIIALLAATAVSLSVSQQQTSTQDLAGSRAYQAARAGVEWGVFQLLRNPTGINCAEAGAANVVAMPAGTTFAGFTVSVECSRHGAATESGTQTETFSLVSTARSNAAAGTATFVERQLTATVAR